MNMLSTTRSFFSKHITFVNGAFFTLVWYGTMYGAIERSVLLPMGIFTISFLLHIYLSKHKARDIVTAFFGITIGFFGECVLKHFSLLEYSNTTLSIYGIPLWILQLYAFFAISSFYSLSIAFSHFGILALFSCATMPWIYIVFSQKNLITIPTSITAFFSFSVYWFLYLSILLAWKTIITWMSLPQTDINQNDD